jgi:hypothetical protein
MMNKKIGAVAVTAALSGCLSGPLSRHADDGTPARPTAVIETQTSFSGIAGFFPYQTTQRHFVRADMRRDESTFKGTGAISGFLIGSRVDARILRPDRDLVWALNDEKKEYTECPLAAGCPRPSRPERPAQRPAEQKPAQPEAKHESGCTMKIASNTFTVTPTGQKRSINGFDTDLYHVAWLVTFQDNTARKSISALNVDVWTTPVTEALRNVFAIEQAYARAYSKNLTTSDKAPVLPPETMSMISAYMARSLASGEAAAFAAPVRQLEKIKGHPILTKIDWDMKGNACAPKESDAPSANAPPPGPAETLSAIAGLLGQRKPENAADAGNKPIISFQIETRMLKVDAEHDSLFVVPQGYKKIDPR